MYRRQAPSDTSWLVDAALAVAPRIMERRIVENFFVKRGRGSRGTARSGRKRKKLDGLDLTNHKKPPSDQNKLGPAYTELTSSNKKTPHSLSNIGVNVGPILEINYRHFGSM